MAPPPTDFARHLSGYFLRHLACERRLSEHTVASRRTAFTLLVEFCGEREGIPAGKITVETLDRDRIARFLGKGNKERSVPLAGPTVAVLREYLERTRARRRCDQTDHLFVNRSGRPLTRGGISYVLRKHCEGAMALSTFPRTLRGLSQLPH